MGGHLVGGHGLIDRETPSNWIQFAFATPVVLVGGLAVLCAAGKSLLTRNLNMFALIGDGHRRRLCL